VSQDGSGLHPIDAPGTSERTWAAWPWLSAPPGIRATGAGLSGLARAAGLAQVASAVIVAAHPDDEVLGVGGVISMLAASRARLRLVAVTDGEGSHRGHADPGELARQRTAETTAAMRALGASAVEVIRLRLPDTGLAGREDELAALAPLVEGFDICLAPWDRDLHPDHEAAGRAARRASPRALYYYPVWMWHWASPADPRVPWGRALRVPLPAHAAEAKRTAIGCFTSQTRDRGHGLGPVLSPGMIAHFTRTTEVLIQ
jgi:LmbE family N-acetylglucosaminyl deacetylase